MSDAFGFSTLIEDAIGLNVDAFQTIMVLFVKPVTYFNAAKDKYWENKYRPSIRIWFALSALTAALQFLWAGKNTPMHDLYTGLMDTGSYIQCLGAKIELCCEGAISIRCAYPRFFFCFSDRTF